MIVETALNTELDEYLSYNKHKPAAGVIKALCLPLSLSARALSGEGPA
jgi:hypothetical protein